MLKRIFPTFAALTWLYGCNQDMFGCNQPYLYFLLFSSVFSTPMLASLLPMVPVDSSAARMPLPGEAT